MKARGERYGIVVSVGTDHHRFDRLIDWVDRSMEAWGSGATPTCLVQHGASRPPHLADGVDRLGREQILDFYRTADVVVVQGGPGSILDARAVGKIPLVVARVPELNEVVDAHQAAFSKVMAQHGDAIVVETWEEFHQKLQEMASSPDEYLTTARVANPDLPAEQLAELLSEVVAVPQKRLRRLARRVGQEVRRAIRTSRGARSRGPGH